MKDGASLKVTEMPEDVTRLTTPSANCLSRPDGQASSGPPNSTARSCDLTISSSSAEDSTRAGEPVLKR